jgi:uncharacterized membrane protein
VTRAVLALLLVALALGAWLRTNGAPQRWVWRDETITLLHTMGRTVVSLDAAPPRTCGELAATMGTPAPGGTVRVVDALASEDSQHPPLYYVIHRTWLDAGGGALGLRALDILLGACAVAAIGWLAFVLAGARAGAFATAFAAVSPFFVLYGQQLREYGLWATLIALSSGLAVLVARRRAGVAPLAAAYAVASAAALWTSPISVLLAPAHAAYAWYAGGLRRALAVAAAYAVAALSFVPWLVVMYDHRAKIASETDWSGTPYTLLALTEKLVFTVGASFTDLGYVSRWGIVLGVLVVIGVAVAAIVLARTDRPSFAALGAVAATTAVLPFLADVVLHEHRTASSRYVTSLVLVSVVCVACALARLRDARAVSAAAVLVALAAFSSAVGTSSPVWWDNHGDSGTIAIGRALQRDPGATVVHDGVCAWILPLSRIAPPAEPVLCGPPGRAAALRPGMYLEETSPKQRAAAAASGLAIVPVVGMEQAESVRAFRRSANVVVDTPTLDKLERAGHGLGG